jgi:uncharacterized membrane protein YbhN (UPF0104 family)
MEFRKIVNSLIKIVLPLVLGCWLLWYIYRDMDFGEIWRVFRGGMRYDILLFSLLFGLLANIIRSYRWGLLIETLEERFQIRNLIYAVLGNYAINFVLPRVGEVWRCGIIAKYERIPFSKLLGTLVIDRVVDTLSVGTIALFIFIFNVGFIDCFLANPNFRIAFPNEWLVAGGVIFVAAVWFTFTRLRHLTLIQRAKGFLLNVWEGMKSVWLMKRKRLFLLQTLLIWVLYFCFFYVTFYAFEFTRHLGVGAGLIAFTASSIAVAVPVQGGIGVWHFTVIATLRCFNVSETDAAAFALVVHGVQSLWQILCGLFGIVALPVVNKS